MADVRCNFKGKHSNTICPLCRKKEDSQQHLLVCEELQEKNKSSIILSLPNYDDLFGNTLEKKAEIFRILQKQFVERKNKLKEESRQIFVD